MKRDQSPIPYTGQPISATETPRNVPTSGEGVSTHAERLATIYSYLEEDLLPGYTNSDRPSSVMLRTPIPGREMEAETRLWFTRDKPRRRATVGAPITLMTDAAYGMGSEKPQVTPTRKHLSIDGAGTVARYNDHGRPRVETDPIELDRIIGEMRPVLQRIHAATTSFLEQQGQPARVEPAYPHSESLSALRAAVAGAVGGLAASNVQPKPTKDRNPGVPVEVVRG